MKKKKTLESIVTAFRLINGSKMSQMENGEKFALIKVMRTLQRTVADFDELVRITHQKMTTPEVSGIITKIQNKTALSDVEKDIIDKFNADIQSCLKSELSKAVEFEIEPLPENAVNNFIASNDFSVSEVMFVYDIIGG